jgi:RNA polymerase sigma-70 factor (ECF subfamily)
MVDNERFTRDWTRVQPVVASYINSLIPDFHAAEDLLQDVAVILLRKYGEYDPSRPFVAWAIGVARLEVLSARRDLARCPLARVPGLAEAVAAAHAEMADELDARAAALRECVARIEGRPREVLRLRYELALPPREITSRVSMTAGAVRVLLSRLRASLQDCIDRRLVAAGGGT